MNRYLHFKLIQIGRKVKKSPFLNKYFPRFKDPVYWAGDRLSFARAGFIGMFCMMLPVPFQMLFGSILAYMVRANIPLATALAWITNPLTMGPIWYGGYRFGTWLLDSPSPDAISNQTLNIPFASSQWFSDVFPQIWQPFFLGNIVLGLIIGSLLYLLIAYFPILKQLVLKLAFKNLNNNANHH